jgi:uncharacterized protein YfaS (alpha-2-macroglobulin family)
MRQRILWRVVFLLAGFACLSGLGGRCLDDAGSFAELPTAPIVVWHSPVRGEALSVNGAIELVFDREMDIDTVEGAFSIEPQVRGVFMWPDGKTVRFLPLSSLERDTEYVVTVGEAATDTEGISLSDAYTFRFRTVGYLQVTQVIPAPGTEEIETDSTFTVMFNRPVVPLLAVSDPRREALPTPLSFEPAIEGTGEWLNTSIYVFTPSAPLSGGTLYTARVPAGLTDPTGWLLADDAVWSVTTQSPEVVWLDPDEDEDHVPVDTTVRVTFNMPIDLKTVAERFTLRKASILGDLFAQPIEGTLEVEGSTIHFTPAEWLEFDQRYVVSLEAGVTSASGGAGMAEGIAWQFKTVPLPRILSTDPRDGAQKADPYTSFSIRFNTAIDPDTVLDNVTIDPAVSAEEIDGYFRTWDNTYVLYFGARPSTEYLVHIGPNIADRYGNHTDQELTVRFRTGPLDPMVWLHVPGWTGTYSAYEPARIVAASLNTDGLDFTLYRLTLEDYFVAQADWYDFVPPKEGRLRHWTVPVAAPLNEVVHVPVDLCEDAGPLPPGIYCLELKRVGFFTSRYRQRHLFAVSTVNLTLKSDADQVLTWATDLDTGTPIPELSLSVHDEDGVQQARGTTDADGIAFLPVSGGRSWWRGLTVVGEEPFVIGSTSWSTGISPWEFGFDSEIPPEVRAHVYTDRPIYRPGQTVYFKGVLRSEDDARYQLCRCGTIDVTVYDATWESVYEETLRVDEFGVFTGEVALSEGTSLGTYRIEAALDGDQFRASFQVAAYRPPEFEVLVTPEKSEIGRGEESWANVDVRYFFGGPVVEAPVEWRIFASSYHFQPSPFARYTFTDVDDPWACWDCWWWTPTEGREVVLQGAGVTDAEGRLEITLPSEMTGEATDVSSDSPDARVGSRTLTIEATATGSDGQVLSGRTTVIDHQGAFYVGLVAQKTIGRAGDAMGIDVVTVDWDAMRSPDQALTYVVYRREWVNTYIENEAGTGSWTWETEDVEVARGTLKTDANAEGTFDFIVPEGGVYKVVVRGRDQRERIVQSSLFVWASSETSVSWRRSDHDRLTLISDKGAYVPGETAEILIPSPFEGKHWALITVERGTIRRHEVIRLVSNSTVYRLPIAEADAPNIYVSAVIVQGRQAALRAESGVPAVASIKVGYAALTVEPIRQTLHIDVTPSSEQALPSDRVDVAIRVTDDRGEPVATSLSLDVVDKAVLTLQPRTPNAILGAFYGRRGLGVSTASGLVISLNRLVQEQIEDIGSVYTDGRQKLGEAGEDWTAVPQTAGGEERAPSGVAAQLPAGLTLREQFEDTAYWNGTVVTDAEGMARIAVDLPDNLTTWIVRGVGVTQQTQVGEGTTELLVTKPLLVRPVAPRFFVVGDRVELAVVVNNNTEQSLLVDVTLGYAGLVLDDVATKLVRIPAAGEARVTWWATVADVPQVDLAFSVVSGSYSDAARPRLTTGPDGTLLVYRYTAPEVVGTAGQLVGEDSRTEVIALPPKYDDRAGELSVRLDPSLAAAMQEGLDYLEHFEYECTEQVVSRFLPNVLTYRALVQLGTDDPELAEKLTRLVEEGMSKLSARQNSDGGWGWWAIDESNPTLTAYVVFSLDKAREAGFEIDEDMLDRGLAYLLEWLIPAKDLDSTWEANRQAWMLYVLAEAERIVQASEYTSDLFALRERLSHYAKAYLAMALHSIRPLDSRIQTLLSDLQNEAILSATGAHWEEEDYDWWAMNTDTRSTAVILDALVRLDPGNALIPNVVRWLMVARRDGIWETTQETAWALIALTDWMVLTGELGGDYEYGVRLNGSDLSSDRVTPETIQESIQLSVGSAELVSDGGNRLTIFRGPGEGRLYYTAHLNVYLPVEEIEPLDRGIVVQRQYLPMDCSSETACEQIDSAAVGETVQVTLTIIAPHDLYYVVVEDPLPAGCEAVDTSLATTSLLDLEPGLFRETDQTSSFWRSFYHWWWQWYSRSELRDEKVVLFADYLPAGTYTYQYTFRATQAGEYHVIPTTAYEFYFPEVFGRADGRLFTVTDPESASD